MKNNFQHTFIKLLDTLKVPVTHSSALAYLDRHPDEGSLLAYADGLEHFKIENAAIRITPNDLLTLSTPFVAFRQEHGGTFSVIKSIKENSVEWFDTQKGWVNDKLEEFTKNWSGVVLLAETDEKSGETNYKIKRRKEILQFIRIPVALGLILAIFTYFIFNAPYLSWFSMGLFCIKTIGMAISCLLLIKSIDNANSLVNKLCNAGSKISCQSILDSPAAKITDWLTWSDAGFIYFFGSGIAALLSMYFNAFIDSFWSLQLVFSFVSLCFATYSLYYQKVKANMWCTLCLGILAVFFAEAAILLFIKPLFSFHFSAFLPWLVSFALPSAFLLLFKNASIQAHESIGLKKELNKLKANPRIFEALMAGQKEMPPIPSDMPIISIGNPNAENIITIVSNPLCSPCANMHTRIERLIADNEDFKCQMVFLSNTLEKDPGGKFIRKLFSLPSNFHHKALEAWFSRNDKNFEKWDASYAEYETHSGLETLQNRHGQWANTAEAKATPTVFINSRLLLDGIQLEELGSFSLKNGFSKVK